LVNISDRMEAVPGQGQPPTGTTVTGNSPAVGNGSATFVDNASQFEGPVGYRGAVSD
jgi:hypothetical protein